MVHNAYTYSMHQVFAASTAVHHFLLVSVVGVFNTRFSTCNYEQVALFSEIYSSNEIKTQAFSVATHFYIKIKRII